jgi:hypothetical protein
MGRGREHRSLRLAFTLIALVSIACSPAPTAAPATEPDQSQPSPSQPATAANPQSSADAGPSAAPGTPSGASSQARIQADVDAGAITPTQSLFYRALAAFGDPRLPERYAGASAWEDPDLFARIEAALPSLDPGQRALLEPFVRRPTDPESAWSAPAAAATGSHAALVAATAPPPKRCTLPLRWFSKDWSPNNTDDRGIRAWPCDISQGSADPDLQAVLDIGSTLWPSMTAAEPNGLGLPIPDTGTRHADGNGKVDVYLLSPLAECRPRGAVCEINDSVAATLSDEPASCGGSGFPARACTSYMLVNRADVSDPELPATFAHEFFHVLQNSHNAETVPLWYDESTASWAEWKYVARSGLFPGLPAVRAQTLSFDRARDFLQNGRSLDYHNDDALDEYRAWIWPLFQEIDGTPPAIYRTYQDLESATGIAPIDAATNVELPFDKWFRDFAVRNAQPTRYRIGVSTGLDHDSWQTKPNLSDFPRLPRRTDYAGVALGLGAKALPVDIRALDASYSTIDSIDPSVRQIDIDARSLANAGSVDIDLLAKMQATGEESTDEWRRIKGTGSRLILCRDHPDDNVELFELVLSNHALGRAPDGESPRASLDAFGSVVITTSNACAVPSGFKGTFSGHGTTSWSGTVTFHRVQPGTSAAECEFAPGQVVYCYEIVGGSVTWVTRTGTGTFSMAAPDGSGEVVLIVSDSRHPDHAGTYELSATPAESVQVGASSGFEIARAWMNAIKYPSYPSDFHLAGTEDSSGPCGYEGCGTVTVWTWDLTPTYGP